MYICTVVTKSHLAQARALARSVQATNPTAQVYVLLADKMDGSFDPATEPFKIIYLQDLGHPEMVEAMCFYYTPFELCCGLRGFLHQYMWNKTPAESWIFLDSDIYVTGDLSEVTNAMRPASVLLNPHMTSPATDDFFQFTEYSALRSGLFNGGFVGLRRCEESARFIQWFASRLVRYALSNVVGMFVDQLWLNQVPLFFKDVTIFNHPGANLAHWNLYKRSFSRDARGGILVDGFPLLFVHFSGWDIENPTQVSKHSPLYLRMQNSQLDVWRELAEKYRMLLLANGHATTKNFPYAFEKFENGTLIEPEMRYEYWDDLSHGPQPGNPFARGPEFYARAAVRK